MLIKVYDNRILNPLKNGSRYIGRKFSETRSFDIDCMEEIYPDGIDTIIIRNPEEATVSALHTELLSHIDSVGGRIHLINPGAIIRALIQNSSAHYSPFLNRWLYEVWKRNPKEIKIVDVSELTNWLELPYEQTEYDFHEKYTYWIDKTKVKGLYSTHYRLLWDILLGLISEDMKWYKKLKELEWKKD